MNAACRNKKTLEFLWDVKYWIWERICNTCASVFSYWWVCGLGGFVLSSEPSVPSLHLHFSPQTKTRHFLKSLHHRKRVVGYMGGKRYITNFEKDKMHMHFSGLMEQIISEENKRICSVSTYLPLNGTYLWTDCGALIFGCYFIREFVILINYILFYFYSVF